MKIREGLDKFSVVYPYWTHLTYSENPEDWDKDLKEQIDFDTEGMFVPLDIRINETTGGFGFEINSLEELEELSKYFWDLGFTHQLRNISHYGNGFTKDRCWYDNNSENIFSTSEQVFLFLYPLQYKDYYKLREALLGLYKIGYLFYYGNNETVY